MRFAEISSEAEYWSWVNNGVSTRIRRRPRQRLFYQRTKQARVYVSLGDDFTALTMIAPAGYSGACFRQLRVLADTECRVPVSMQAVAGDSCVPRYNAQTAATSRPDPSYAYEWYQDSVLDEAPFNGEVSRYPGSGFNVTFYTTDSLAEVQSKLETMQGWATSTIVRAPYSNSLQPKLQHLLLRAAPRRVQCWWWRVSVGALSIGDYYRGRRPRHAAADARATRGRLHRTLHPALFPGPAEHASALAVDFAGLGLRCFVFDPAGTRSTYLMRNPSKRRERLAEAFWAGTGKPLQIIWQGLGGRC